MTYDQALKFIHSIPAFSKKLDLVKISKLLDLIGNPHHKLRFIHVAGTNGKGSTCAMLSNILKTTGLKTGLYISPFIIDFRERIQINGEMISKDELAEITAYIKPMWHKLSDLDMAPSEFELVLAIALEYFVRHSCDIVVLEVGMGGRLDATNVIPPPLAAVITSISFDHIQYLGGTLEEIATEKSGIIKKGTPVITYPSQSPEVLGVIMKHCAQTGNELIIPNYNSVEILSQNLSGSRFLYGEREYQTPFAGEHQIYNTLMVIETAKFLKVNYDHIYTGIKEAKFPARLEIMHNNPLIIIDGAHNVSGMIALTKALNLVDGKKIHCIMGMVGDKDIDAVVGLIAPKLSSVIATYDSSNPRFITPEALASKLKQYLNNVFTFPDADSALKHALSTATIDDVILVCGSLYLASAVRKSINKYLKGEL